MLLGHQSKREVLRARFRTTAAMLVQARDQGRHLGGRPPYGYRLVDAGPHPNRAHARWGRRLHRLDPDPATAPHVRWMFAQRLAGSSVAGIARALNERGIPCPSSADPERNRHRTGDGWTLRTVAAILANPAIPADRSGTGKGSTRIATPSATVRRRRGDGTQPSSGQSRRRRATRPLSAKKTSSPPKRSVPSPHRATAAAARTSSSGGCAAANVAGGFIRTGSMTGPATDAVTATPAQRPAQRIGHRSSTSVKITLWRRSRLYCLKTRQSGRHTSRTICATTT
jgi:Recombinase